MKKGLARRHQERCLSCGLLMQTFGGSLTYEIFELSKSMSLGSKGICGSNLPLGFPVEQPQTSTVELRGSTSVDFSIGTVRG